jgi:hypothetical protein
MKFLKIFLIILYFPLTILILIILFGLIHRWANPGYKSMSNYDLRQLGLAITIILILICFVLIIEKVVKKN